MAIRRGLRAALAALLVPLVLGGCTTQVTIEGTVPTPLISPMPARVGVYYSDAFRSFRHEEVIRQHGSWKIDLGAQNFAFFQNLIDAMFEGTLEVAEPPVDPAIMAAEGLDGVFVPEIIKYGFLAPSVSGLKFYSASIHYRVTLLDARGAKVGDWTIVGYGKAEGGAFSQDEALQAATVDAIRDGGARIAIELRDQPAVKNWLDAVSRAGGASDETSG